MKAPQSSPPTHKVAPGRLRLWRQAQRAEARSMPGVPSVPRPSPLVHAPRARAQHPIPTGGPEAPAQSEAAHAAVPAGRQPSSRACAPAASAPPQSPGLATLTVRGAQSARGSAAGPHPRARLRSRSRSGSGAPWAGLSSAAAAAAKSEAQRACACARACVCARACARACACARGRVLRSALLPPAPRSPRRDARRLPNARSRPPGRSPSRARARRPGLAPPAASPPAPHSCLPPPWGAREGPLARPPPRLAPPQAPWRPLERPSPSTLPEPGPGRPTPARGAPTPRRRLPARPPRRPGRALPRLPRPLLRRRLPFCLLSPLPGPRAPGAPPVFHLPRRRPLPAPRSPPPCAAPHILRVTWGAAPRAQAWEALWTARGPAAPGTRRPRRLPLAPPLLARARRAGTSRAGLGCLRQLPPRPGLKRPRTGLDRPRPGAPRRAARGASAAGTVRTAPCWPPLSLALWGWK